MLHFLFHCLLMIFVLFKLWCLSFWHIYIGAVYTTTVGEGNGKPIQYSCLEIPMERGALWAAVYGVALSRTWLKWLAAAAANYDCDYYTSSVQPLSCVCLFVTPWTAVRQASLSVINSWNLLKLMSIEWVMPSNYLILPSPSSPAFNLSQYQGLFKWVSAAH